MEFCPTFPGMEKGLPFFFPLFIVRVSNKGWILLLYAQVLHCCWEGKWKTLLPPARSPTVNPFVAMDDGWAYGWPAVMTRGQTDSDVPPMGRGKSFRCAFPGKLIQFPVWAVLKGTDVDGLSFQWKAAVWDRCCVLLESQIRYFSKVTSFNKRT